MNLPNVDDIINFRDRFDGYVFLDGKGNEYAAVVELAPCQKIPRQRRKDPKSGTLENDAEYLKFQERLKLEATITLPSLDKTLEEIERKEKERKDAGKGGPVIKTPLIEYLEQRKEEKERRREERRKQELERRKQKEVERRQRIAKEREERERRIQREREKEKTKDREKDETTSKEHTGDRWDRKRGDRSAPAERKKTRDEVAAWSGSKPAVEKASRDERVFTRSNQARDKSKQNPRRKGTVGNVSSRADHDQQTDTVEKTDSLSERTDSEVQNRKLGSSAGAATSKDNLPRLSQPRKESSGQNHATQNDGQERTAEAQPTSNEPAAAYSRRKAKPAVAIYQPRARRQQGDAETKQKNEPD